MEAQPSLDGSVPALTLTPSEVTTPLRGPNVFYMPTTWPVEEFVAYLRALMSEANISDYAELSRLSGVSQTQFSNWRKGTSRPSRESLSKIAKVLDVKPVNLWLTAGIADKDDLDLAEQPDLAVLPRELLDLINLWRTDALTDQEREFLRTSIAALISGIRNDVVHGRRRTPRVS
jgi:transcriptional regulator with XRE-family HTH domain